MKGTDGVRHCALCNLNVYNLSWMTTEESEKLLSEASGRLCVRYFKREDGTILTKDCPVGVSQSGLPKLRKLSLVIAAGLACIGLGLRPPVPADNEPTMGDRMEVSVQNNNQTLGKVATQHTTGVVARDIRTTD